ncbi:MAG: hypothetical protein ACRDSP_25090 [Pseudonocardiaceae bacterium]
MSPFSPESEDLVWIGLHPATVGHRRVRITDTGHERYAPLSDGKHTAGTGGGGR